MMRMTLGAVGVDEPHRDAIGFAQDIERDLVAFQPYRAAALAPHRPARQLARNLPLALAEDVVDGSADRRQPAGDFPFGHANREPLGKLLGDEAGGEIAAAPAWMI